MRNDMIKRNRQRKIQDKLYRELIRRGYTDDDRVQMFRPDGYFYTLKDIKQYLIWGVEHIDA